MQLVAHLQTLVIGSIKQRNVAFYLGVRCMFPYVMIGDKMITGYMIMTLIGIFVMGIFCVRKAIQYHTDDNDMIVLLLIAAIGAFLGSHILYGIVNINLIIKVLTHLNRITSFEILVNCFIEIFGGAVFYGGLLGGLLAGFIYVKKKHLDTKLYSYIVAPAIPLFHMFGRIGCFLSGCCYGIESKFGFTFTHSLVESANGVSRFPVQLVEAFCNLLLFLLLYILQKKDKCRNSLLALSLYLSFNPFIS